MKKLLILSGKGGTGKTSIAGAFMHYAKSKVMADCDVDAPNLHILKNLNKEDENYDFVGSKKAIINSDKCIGCKLCLNNCHFGAIELVDGKCQVNEFACEGCGLCNFLCPNDAITMVDDYSGVIKVYKKEDSFVTAKLKMGRGNSGKLVTAVKKLAAKNAEDKELMIIDGSPGIGCPVIASISGVDLILAVAEPSLSGISDLKRLVKSAMIQNVKVVVCINKYDINQEMSDMIKAYCESEGIPFVGVVPYDSQVSKAINAGRSIAEYDSPASKAIYEIFLKVNELIKGEDLKGE